MEDEHARDAVFGASAAPHCNDRATEEIVALYQRLRAAPSGSEEFELLNAEFNRACQADPRGVLRALEGEAFA